jgi:hypothetical protein
MIHGYWEGLGRGVQGGGWDDEGVDSRGRGVVALAMNDCRLGEAGKGLLFP